MYRLLVFTLGNSRVYVGGQVGTKKNNFDLAQSMWLTCACVVKGRDVASSKKSVPQYANQFSKHIKMGDKKQTKYWKYNKK